MCIYIYIYIYTHTYIHTYNTQYCVCCLFSTQHIGARDPQGGRAQPARQ